MDGGAGSVAEDIVGFPGADRSKLALRSSCMYICEMDFSCFRLRTYSLTSRAQAVANPKAIQMDGRCHKGVGGGGARKKACSAKWFPL